MQTDILLTALLDKKSDIISQLGKFEELKSQLDTVVTTINKLYPDYQDIEVTVSKGKPVVTAILNGYDKSWTWKAKVAYAINAKNRFLHVREIAEYLRSQEQSDDVEFYLEKVRTQTGVLKGEGAIVRFTEGKNLSHSFWGSPNWIKNGTILHGHEYAAELTAKDKVTVG